MNKYGGERYPTLSEYYVRSTHATYNLWSTISDKGLTEDQKARRQELLERIDDALLDFTFGKYATDVMKFLSEEELEVRKESMEKEFLKLRFEVLEMKKCIQRQKLV